MKNIMKYWYVVFAIHFSVMLVSCANPASDPHSEDTLEKYAKEYRGEWLRIDTGDTWYISSDSIKIDNFKSSKQVTLAKQ